MLKGVEGDEVNLYNSGGVFFFFWWRAMPFLAAHRSINNSAQV
jgi:hypothetical protein